jgi:hypothetical protein
MTGTIGKAGHAEVDKDRVQGRVHNYVSGMNVPVDHAARLKRFQSSGDLRGDMEPRALARCPPLLTERLALDPIINDNPSGGIINVETGHSHSW